MSWQWTEPEMGNETLISISLAEAAEGPEVTLKHENFTEEQFMKSHEEGWGGSLTKLEAMFG